MLTQLVWFKRDLRITDHQPLARAAAAGPCICLYVYESEIIHAEDFDPSHLRFINESLRELDQNLRRLGARLTLRAGRLPEVFDRLWDAHRFARIWSHQETGNAVSYARDRRVADWARRKGVAFEEIPQNGVVRRLSDRDGWAAKRQRRMKQPITPEPPVIRPVDELSHGAILDHQALGIAASQRSRVQIGGQAEAEALLDSFLAERSMNYRTDMSSPVTGETGCSRLSPYIAYGNLSIRQIQQRSTRRMIELREEKRSGKLIEPGRRDWLRSLTSFHSRLSWHCHFIQKLEDEPEIEFRNINRAFDGLREEDFCEEKFAAWCEGRTGYPMVDACMRALHQTGWINFRMRAMLVSFAAYHLWLHWRRPALHLARLFLDYEPGIHYNQCQMQSGVTGINTVRIYSPAKQARDQDPQGVFIRRFVPELENVPAPLLAEPHNMTVMEQTMAGCRIGKDYPAPIVDHQTAYRKARTRIYQVKNSVMGREQAAIVYRKHGSRRPPSRERRQ